MKVRMIVNGLGCCMAVPEISFAIPWIHRKIEKEIAQAVKYGLSGASKIEIEVSINISAGNYEGDRE